MHEKNEKNHWICHEYTGAGQAGHFRHSYFISRDIEVLTTNAFFSKKKSGLGFLT